jgi:hypothetical protein
MKPENVFLQRTGDGEEIVKIVDFGIAQLRSKDEAVAETKHRRLTRTGMIFGTPEYMAPEQASGKHADLRADIYAVGIIVYEMLTGAVPFIGETFLGVLTKHLNEVAPPMTTVYPDLRISPQLQAVVMHALEKDPAARYQSMLEFAQAITASPEAAALGYRQTVAPGAEGAVAYVPHTPGTPTEQQFLTGAAAASATADLSRAAATQAHQEQGAARAETHLGGEATTQPPVRGRGAVAALIGVVLFGGASALFMAHRGSEKVTPSAEGADVPQKAELLPTPTEAASSAAAAVLATANAAPSATVAPTSGIRLEVSSDPGGATLMKNGFQVCDSTPCEVLAAPNETLEFEAQKGQLHGSAKVLAQRDQKVNIKLAGASSVAAKNAAAARMCEVEVDGLKILRPCK